MKKNIVFILFFISLSGYSQFITPNNIPVSGFDTIGSIIGRQGKIYVLKKTNVVSPLSLVNDSTIGWSGTQGDLLYFSSSSAISLLAKDANATRYLSNQGTSNNPSWNQVNLTNGVTGVLPIANGGTNNGSLSVTNGTIYYGDGSKLLGLAPGNNGQHLVLKSGIPFWGDTTAVGAGGGGAADSAYFWNLRGGNLATHTDTLTYLGTNTNTNLRFKTAATQRMVIDSLGNVGIGFTPTTYPTAPFHVTGNSATNSQARIGSFEVQNAASVNNLILSDNVIYNSGFKRRAAGYANFIQMIGKEMQFNVCATSTAGSAISQVIPFKFNTDGKVALGGNTSNTADVYTNAFVLLDANGMSLGKNGSLAATNSILELKSNTKGFLPTRFTESEVGSATAGGTMGLIVYDSTSNSLLTHNGTNFNGRFFTASGVSNTLTYGSDNVFTGTTSTWTLPAVNGVLLGRQNAIKIKNRGSGTITLNSNSGNTLYTTSAVGTINIVAGAACELMPDGTYFNVMFNQ